MAQQEPGVWPSLTNKDSMRRSASSEETEQSCTMWDATSFTAPVVKRGQIAERSGCPAALVMEKLTEPRVDVDAWGHPGLPHIRLNFTVVDAEAFHYSSAMRKAQETAPAAAQAESEGEQIWRNEKRCRSHGHSHAAQRAAAGTGRTPPWACWIQARNHQGSGERRWTATTGVAKTP